MLSILLAGLISVAPPPEDEDGELNILDDVAFPLAWQAGDPAGDCDANGRFDIVDFACFQQRFVTGCE